MYLFKLHVHTYVFLGNQIFYIYVLFLDVASSVLCNLSFFKVFESIISALGVLVV